MAHEAEISQRTPLPGFSRVAGLLVAMIGGLVFVGRWLLGSTILQSGWTGLGNMKANTALAFVLAGMSLRILSAKPIGRAARFGQACTVLVMLIGIFTLFEYWFGWDLRIDQLLVPRSRVAASMPFPTRMAQTTAL